MTDFAWDPDSYLELMAEEVPDYARLQDELLAATRDIAPSRVLELGTGSGETAGRVLSAHPRAQLVGIDASEEMLSAAAARLDSDRTKLHLQRLQDPLPAGPYDLAISALAVHHLDGPGKADLFARVSREIVAGGRFVLADLVVPDRPEDMVTPVDWVEDLPSAVPAQLDWLRAAGFDAAARWHYRDLAVLIGERTEP